MYFQTRWKTLPREPPPLDDTDVDDWLPCVVVLQGTCMFFYLLSTEFFPFAFVIVDFKNHVNLDIEASIDQEIIRRTKKC
ncbi:hypothetical protein RchiOBHm_Chr1g0343991 [Rosa chinensis]|uniref:Uncharacterized protein n=1 Tax=Rosa chinensis TaxID=74649 RepID=A0A2P6SEE7_ROSCH|nr:hypothetical protein RchiOBHm_Chr1g0343991 [Rosa chinensis]